MGNCCDANDSDEEKKEDEIDEIKQHEKISKEMICIESNIFENTTKCNKSNPDMNSCQSIDRIVQSLKYYASLNRKSIECQNAFSDFIKTTYPNYLNDIIHLITAHEADLELIHNKLFNHYKFHKCELSSCILTERHYENKDENDEFFNFYQNTFDSIHYYLFHLFDVGLRISTYNDHVVNDEQINSLTYVDKILSKQRQTIRVKRQKLPRIFNRFKTKHNKFNMESNINQSNDAKNIKSTRFDQLFESIQYENVNLNATKTLKRFLVDEDYDTDALIEDVQEYPDEMASNICAEIRNKSFLKHIFMHFNNQRLQNMVFSVGFTFWYWPYYAKDNNIEYTLTNYNDFGGYSIRDLYIKKGIYDNFKSEILQYSNGINGKFTIQMYNNDIWLKSNQYISTDIVQNIKAEQPRENATRHYNIKYGEPITVSHIMSLTLYCDFTGLCTSFSSTFRRLNPAENLTSVKQRHEKYWWMSKFMREAVEIYGKEYIGANSITGPFFTGLSYVMVMPAFSIRLNGPTSTTKNLQIANNFAKDNGMIIMLNNQHFGGGYFQRFFNTCWLSKYKEEDERLTIGGSFSLQIQCIIHTSTLQNFSRFFKPLFYFDSVLSGNQLPRDSKKVLNNKALHLISSLIEHEKDNISGNKYDSYIKDTFHMFCLSKKTISINMRWIEKNTPVGLHNIMFYAFEGKVDVDNIVYLDDKTNTNLLKDSLLNIFPNLRYVVIYATTENGRKSYVFSLSKLMQWMRYRSTKTKNMIQCKIRGTWKDTENEDDGNRSWLYYQYQSFKKSKIIESKILSVSLNMLLKDHTQHNDIMTIYNYSMK